MVEAIGEDRTEAGAVPTTEMPLSVVSRVADILLGAIAGTGLDIVEGLGKGMEWVARRLNRNHAQYMEELEKYYSSPNDHVSGV